MNLSNKYNLLRVGVLRVEHDVNVGEGAAREQVTVVYDSLSHPLGHQLWGVLQTARAQGGKADRGVASSHCHSQAFDDYAYKLLQQTRINLYAIIIDVENVCRWLSIVLY